MVSLLKHMEFFNPIEVKKPVHIIGCGAIGSHVAIQLAHLGITDIVLYDFDTVEDKNVANQAFGNADIGKKKVDALKEMILRISDDINVTIVQEGYKDQKISGYVFMCVDSIKMRRTIAENNKYNIYTLAMFDFRMRLSDAQYYAADWKDEEQKENFLASMNFTDEEAKEETPVSVCGTTLSIIPTVCAVVSCGIANFINFIKGEPIKLLGMVDPFAPSIQAFGPKK